MYISVLLHIPLPSPPSLSIRELQSPAGHFDIKNFECKFLLPGGADLWGSYGIQAHAVAAVSSFALTASINLSPPAVAT